MKKTLVLYMPVLHAGYLELFKEVKPSTIVLVTEETLKDLPEGLEYLRKKDIIRAVSPESMRLALSPLCSSKDVDVVCSRGNLSLLKIEGETEIVMPEEDISLALAEQYFGGVERVTFVMPPAPRLRYHRNNVEEKKLLVPDRRIAITEIDREMMRQCTNAPRYSPDWYRQVGLVLRLQDGKTIVAYNEHQPHHQIAATFGDPRSLFKSGVRTDLSYGDHAEHVGIGEAARRGISTDGAWVYITDFPCLPCSRLLVRAGVRRVFYRNPSYGLLDADAYLRLKQVELIEVLDGN